MESAKIKDEYTLMIEYDFSKPINAAVIFDSDEDESDKEVNSLLPEKHDSDNQKVSKSLDMPNLDGHNSKTETKLDDVITEVIKKYVCETKKACDKKPPKRKSSTTSDNIKNKLQINMNHMKEIRSQHNEPSSRSPNKQNCQLASLSAEPRGPPSNVPNDIRNQNNTCISNPLTNTANGQPKSTYIEPKSESIEESIPSSCLPKEISTQLNASTSSLPPYYTDNSPTVSICVDQQIEPLRETRTTPNIASDGKENPLDTSTSSLPSIAYKGQPISACIELKAEFIKDLNPQSNLSNEITNRQHIFSTSNLPPNIDNSCTFTNVSEVIGNKLNTSSSSLPTNTSTRPVSTDATSKIQTQQNNDNSVTYDHLKPLLDTVSEHLILIWNRLHSCNGLIKDRSVQNFEFNEELRKQFSKYKMRLFDLSYSTVVNVILPRIYDKNFVKDFIDNTVALSKSVGRQTTKEISMLYLEMINWAQKMKHQIASESVFDHEIMRQSLAPIATNTRGLPELVKESNKPHSTQNHTCSIRPPETERPPPWIARNPPPPYTNNPAPLYTNNPPPSYTNYPPPPSYTSNIPSQYINILPPQTYVNNVITPEQTKVINSTYRKHQFSTTSMQNKKSKLNQRQQISVAEIAKRVVNPDGPRQEMYSPNIPQVNNNNSVNVSSSHTYHYHPTYVSTLPNPNHARSAYCINNDANNYPHPRTIVESECQKLIRTSKSQNVPNNTTSSQNQNHCFDTSPQGINNYPNNVYLNQANNIQQESDRSSISRDSGFYSPRDLEQEPATSPLITHVTSLNPDAVNIIQGNCFVCGKNTNQKCVGCYETYYCSYGCQNFDWRNHMTNCNTNQELRKLLSK